MLTRLITKQLLGFSTKVPRLDMTRYLSKQVGWEQDCKQAARLMRQFGLVYAYDPRFDNSKRERFLDLMEQYFVKRSRQLDEGQELKDHKQGTKYSIGLKTSSYEKFSPFVEVKQQLKPPNHSLTPLHNNRDPVWRFHYVLDYKDNIYPKDFPNLKSVYDDWGNCLKGTALLMSQMVAIGLNLQKNALSRFIQNGMFYLSPSGCNTQKTKQGDVIASFHRDFSLFTVHGRSRFAGLYAWLLTGQKFLVEVPDNHILIQGGGQLEYVTGGYLKAAFHEVIHNERVEQRKQQNMKNGKPLWRVSSTMFCHMQGDLEIEPYDQFRTPEVNAKYPRIQADDFLLSQLNNLYGKGQQLKDY